MVLNSDIKIIKVEDFLKEHYKKEYEDYSAKVKRYF